MSTAELLRRSWQSWFSQDFRRVGPAWLQFVWTGVFCAAVALGFTIVGFLSTPAGNAWRSPQGWWRWYEVNLLMSLAIGFTIHLLFEGSARLIGAERLRRFTKGQRAAYFSLVPMLGVTLAWPAAVWFVLDVDLRRWIGGSGGLLLGGFASSVLLCLVLYKVFDLKARQIEAEKAAVEAQLRLLQGQIEPHFLFNTLANVVALVESDAPRARAMLESFIDYLRASLAGLRGQDHTLGAEVRLVEAYLQIAALRMPGRLGVTLEIDPALRGLPLPPLMLQPLVENAVVHGIEPQRGPGSIAVRAEARDGLLRLEVEDTGRGLDAPPVPGPRGSGSAIANIRERLDRAYGDEASLTLEPVAPHGTRARLSLPLENTCPPA